MKMRTLMFGLICVMLASIVVGYVLGRLRSPDWNNPQAVTVHIRQRHSWHHVGSAGNGPILELRLVAGDKTWYYRTDTEKVESRYRSLGENVEMPRGATLEDHKELIIVGGGGTGGLLAYFAGPLEKVVFRGAKNTLAAAVVSASGIAFGYSSGYRQEPNYASESFMKQVTDVQLWQTLAKDHLAEYGKKTEAENRKKQSVAGK